MKQAVILFIAILLVISPAMPARATEGDDVSVVSDLTVARPLGFVSTVLGSVLFFLALPFAVTSRSVNETAQTLVGEPFEFTFTRPLGYFSHTSYLPMKRASEKKNARTAASGTETEATKPGDTSTGAEKKGQGAEQGSDTHVPAPSN